MVGFITRDVSCPVSRNGSYFLLWPQPQMQIIDQYSADGQTTQYQNTWTKNLTHNHHLGILPKSASEFGDTEYLLTNLVRKSGPLTRVLPQKPWLYF